MLLKKNQEEQTDLAKYQINKKKENNIVFFFMI